MAFPFLNKIRHPAKKLRLLLIAIGILSGALLLLLLPHARPTGRDQATLPAGIEVNDYQGENLSSVADFRENSIKGPQNVDLDTYRLSVTGLVRTPLELSYDEVVRANASYKKVVTLNCVEGWSVKILWEGIKVSDLLAQAGVLPEAKIAIFRAVDGYSTAFPIDYLTDRGIILAYKMNGAVLLPERGFPFQLVAEDKWGYKWIKWITEIELSADTDYRGYWESRGYSKDGDLNGSFFEAR
jgi:DMSO/TMAO reductase YedYZ molybdopterin-dependent catalytic subunit